MKISASTVTFLSLLSLSGMLATGTATDYTSEGGPGSLRATRAKQDQSASHGFIGNPRKLQASSLSNAATAAAAVAAFNEGADVENARVFFITEDPQQDADATAAGGAAMIPVAGGFGGAAMAASPAFGTSGGAGTATSFVPASGELASAAATPGSSTSGGGAGDGVGVGPFDEPDEVPVPATRTHITVSVGANATGKSSSVFEHVVLGGGEWICDSSRVCDPSTCISTSVCTEH